MEKIVEEKTRAPTTNMQQYIVEFIFLELKEAQNIPKQILKYIENVV